MKVGGKYQSKKNREEHILVEGLFKEKHTIILKIRYIGEDYQSASTYRKMIFKDGTYALWKKNWVPLEKSLVKEEKIPEVPCPYCGGFARLVGGETIYPHMPDLYHLHFWLCLPCDAYVGCHKNSVTFQPLGRLANSELRIWKQKAHEAFDPLWKSGSMRRGKAYQWLATAMDLSLDDCHIGHFDLHQCQRVIFLSKEKRQSLDIPI